MERDARNNAVLGSLSEGNRAGGGLDVEIRPHAAHLLHASHQVLQVRVAVGNHLRPAVYRGYAVLGGGDAYRAADGFRGADGQRVPRPCDAHVGIGACKAEIGEYAVAVVERKRVSPILVGKLPRDVVLTARHKARYGVVVRHEGHNLVVGSPRPVIGVIGAEVQAADGAARLAVGASGFTASRDELPHEGLGGEPFLVIAPREVMAVALVSVEQGKPHGFPLAVREGVPCVRGSPS